MSLARKKLLDAASDRAAATLADARIPSLPDANIAPKLHFVGVFFDRLAREEALAAILERPADLPFAPVVTPNAAHVVRIAEEGGDIARAYDNAWLCLNDSRVIEFLAHLKGMDLPSVPGSTLVASMLADPRLDRNASVLLVGGDHELFEEFVSKAGLTRARHFAAPMGLLTEKRAFDVTVAFIEANPAQLVFLAVGSPQQELIAETLRRRGRAVGVGLCIGAAIEFFVGRKQRAPAWMSRFGLEWLFRLMSEPQRMWRRYLIESPKILGLCLRERRG